MKKNLNEILTDGVTPTEELITDEMISVETVGFDLDRVTLLTLEKTNVIKAAKPSIFRRYYKQFSALAACLVLAVGVLVAYRIWGTDVPTVDADSDGTDVKDYITMDGIVWGDDEIYDSVTDLENDGDNIVGAPAETQEDVFFDPNVPVDDTDGMGCEMPELPDWDTNYNDDAEPDSVFSVYWNGIEVGDDLYQELLKNTNATIAVRVENTLAHVPSDYVYNGKSVAEWNEIIIELIDKECLIMEAYKLGYGLVYGEDIYTVGSPTFGEIWSEKYYYEVVEEYGEIFNLLYAEYESFLTENDLWDDVADDIGLYWDKMETVAYDMWIECVREMDRLYINVNEAREEYIRENSVLLGVGSDFYDAVKSLGADVYANGNHAYIFVTAKQLAELADKINGDGLLFLLATKQQFASEFDENGDPVKDTTCDPSDDVQDTQPIPVPDDETICDTDIAYDDWETETMLPDTTEAWETAIEETYYPNE